MTVMKREDLFEAEGTVFQYLYPRAQSMKSKDLAQSGKHLISGASERSHCLLQSTSGSTTDIVLDIV